MPKFRKRPVVIEAVQLRWDNWGEICSFVRVGRLADGQPEGGYVHADGTVRQGPDLTLPGGGRLSLLIPTLEGVMQATEGDWIIRGVKGEMYPCKPEIFEATYEPVSGGISMMVV